MYRILYWDINHTNLQKHLRHIKITTFMFWILLTSVWRNPKIEIQIINKLMIYFTWSPSWFIVYSIYLVFKILETYKMNTKYVWKKRITYFDLKMQNKDLDAIWNVENLSAILAKSIISLFFTLSPSIFSPLSIYE